jgi:catechol 2,3-dioxygenase
MARALRPVGMGTVGTGNEEAGVGDSGPSMDEPTGGGAEAGIPAPGYRLPAATRLGGVALQVGDLTRSVEYYQAVLGLRALGEGADGTEMGGDDGTVLLRLREQRGAAPVPRRGRLGLYHYAILLPDRPAFGAFLTHLGSLGLRPGMSDHNVSEAIYLNDPDGLGIEVYVDRPRAAWRYRGRELHMTTEPLDVSSVLAQAGGPWSAMPAGTVMGHVHLFVADLEIAAAFYHRALGFDRMVWSYPGALFMAAGGYHHHLGTNTWAADAAPAGPEDARLLEWRVVLPSADEVEAAGTSVDGAGYAVERSEGGWSAADPWGTRVRVLAGEPVNG